MSIKCCITNQTKGKVLGLAKNKISFIYGPQHTHKRDRKQKCNREEGIVAVYPRTNNFLAE